MRRSSLAGVAVTAAALAVLLSAPSFAGDKEDVAAAAVKWTDAFSEEMPDRIVALYDKEAVLWGTLSPKRNDDTAAIRDYMVGAFAALPARKVVFGNQLIRIYGDTAINSGDYTFSFTRDGKPQSLPARYSFVYRKTAGGWAIVDHHSSPMPTPPR